MLWLWELRNVAILGAGLLASVFALANGMGFTPLLATAVYGFLSIRLEAGSVIPASPSRKTKPGIRNRSSMAKHIRDHGFHVRIAGEQDVKRCLSMYYQQDVTTEYFENFDVESAVIEYGE